MPATWSVDVCGNQETESFAIPIARDALGHKHLIQAIDDLSRKLEICSCNVLLQVSNSFRTGDRDDESAQGSSMRRAKLGSAGVDLLVAT